MHADLARMRNAIFIYHSKHGRNPSSLSDLVRDGELREIPLDPITHEVTWRLTTRENVRVDDFQTGGAQTQPPEIIEIHSGAIGVDSNGKAWSSY